MHFAHVLLATIVAVAGKTEIDVSDADGNAVSQARATVDGTVFPADPSGRIFLTAGPGATITVEARGCSSTTVSLSQPRVAVKLACRLPVIGSVRVATGSPQALHQLPVPASVLDREQIATNPATTADGLLRVMPGVDRNRSNSMFTNYGQVRVSFTGAGTDRGLVLVDGIPAQDGFGGQINWALYPSLDLTRAELLRG
ncbi:MAG: TonB-dependent receptor, partial [Vulcanimicrobiaceae bacterium]